VAAWIGLLVLTATTFGLSFVDLGAASSIVALGIAGAKAVLVAVVFMHLVEEPFTVRAVAVVACLFVTTLVALVLLDVSTREPTPALPVGVVVPP
jgi:cytochrome c oxidase subunit 4